MSVPQALSREPACPEKPTAKVPEPAQSVTLALRPREAARALGISDRLLWSLTNRKLIPHVRVGARIIYPVDLLQEWLAKQAEKGASR